MIHAENEAVRPLLFKGNFGLERETLRITEDGFLATSPNPFQLSAPFSLALFDFPPLSAFCSFGSAVARLYFIRIPSSLFI